MLTRIHGKIVFECEGCSETLETDERDFSEAKDILDNSGWKARLTGRDWSHYCPLCRD